MAEPGDTAGKVDVLVSESQADTAARATESLDPARGGFSFCRMGRKPHNATPAPFLELERSRRYLVAPGKGNRTIA